MAITTENYIEILSDLDRILQILPKPQVLPPRTPGTLLFSKSFTSSAKKLEYDSEGAIAANFHNLDVIQDLTDTVDLKDKAVDTIQSIRDKIQNEHDSLAALTEEVAANQPNLYLSYNREENSDNFFADLKKVKLFINQIPLDLKAVDSETQQFAASCLTLITKLMKDNQKLLQHLQYPVTDELVSEEQEPTCGSNLKCSFKPHCMMS